MPKPAIGDGAPHETSGPDADTGAETIGHLRAKLVWFGPSPFMVILLRQLVRELRSMEMLADQFDPGDGALRLEDIDEDTDLGSMEGMVIAELLARAVALVPEEHRERLGIDA